MENHSEALKRIMLAVNRLDGAYYFFAKRLGVNENALAFYYALADGEPHSQKEVSDQWLIPRTTIHSIVKSALAEGYIQFTLPRKAKEKTMVLTHRGRAYVDDLLAQINIAEEQAIQSTLERYSPEFITALEYFSGCLSQGLHPKPGGMRTMNHEQL